MTKLPKKFVQFKVIKRDKKIIILVLLLLRFSLNSRHNVLQSMKGSTPLVNFTNILQAAFMPISCHHKNLQTQTVSTEKMCQTLMCGKTARKMLVKLTP